MVNGEELLVAVVLVARDARHAKAPIQAAVAHSSVVYSSTSAGE